ncbi:glycosyltransferase [Roseomonas sp. CAU 1739]|uniref:glycosyltransferase n=1 Tax=Roseomonas sp. CAU 1739 TaxID=3140364 RepID=UPI00325AF209
MDLPFVEMTASAGVIALPRALLSRGGILLVDVTLGAALPDGAARLFVDGEPLPPPSATALPGARRALHAARPRRPLLSDMAIELRFGADAAARFPLPTLLTPTAFAAGFEGGEREALLRFLAATCAPMLRAGADIDLATLCQLLAAPVGVARRLARPESGMSAWQTPGAPEGVWRLLAPAGITSAGIPEAGVLLLDGAPPPGSLLLPPAPMPPLRLAMPTGQAGLRATIRAALAGRRGAPRLLPALADRARRDPRAAALLREVQLLAPARPTRIEDATGPVGGGIDLAVSDHEGGVFLCGWLRDPLGLVAGLSLRGPGAAHAVPAAALHRVARPDIADRFARAPLGGAGARPGFLAHLPGIDPAGTAQWQLALQFAGDGAAILTAPPGLLPPETARDLVLRAVHPSAADAALLDAVIMPAASALHRAVLRDAKGAPGSIAFGTLPARPRASLIVPLYRNLRFLRFQLAAFARDAECRAAELIYVLDSPEQRHEVEHLLRGMASMLGIGLRLVVMPRNGGYASACNAGAAEAHSPTLLFLNSDVLPAGEGWLGRMLARLARDRRLAAVGPRLLFEDGSIQHAGLLFRRGEDGVWLNDHYCKGFPRQHAAARQARIVPAVTGAALLVGRDAFERVDGFCTDYILGDFEDSDLCLKLRAAGGEIAYEPGAELFHFERQSIALHEGHSRTLAGAVNRRLHHLRWDAAIAALMTRFAEA